jgi:TRAP-type mannitol/chloroaromatic compound transport system permease small subunit
MSDSSADIKQWVERIDRVAVISGQIISWMIIPMVLSLTYEVISRYLFNAPTLWAYDMTFMLYGSFFMLGAAFTLQRRGHIRTDSLYESWSIRTKGWVDGLCYLVFFFPFVYIFVFTGFEYFWKAFTTGEKFVSSPWMPLTWPFKLAMPLSGILLAVQGVSELMKCVYAIQHDRWPSSKEAV